MLVNMKASTQLLSSLFKSSKVLSRRPKSGLARGNASPSSRHLSSSSKDQTITTTPLPEITDEIPEITSHHLLHQYSIKQSDEFWSTLAKERLLWRKEFTITANHNHENAIFRWFSDGEINVSENCVDRHAEEDPNRVALIWEKDEPGMHEKVTYRELKNLVCQMSNILKENGVQKSDRVIIYLPVMPLAVASMLACARIGAIHSVVFAGFSSEALATRIRDAEAETIVTADRTKRGGKWINLKKTVDEAVARCPKVKRVFVTSRTGEPLKLRRKDINLDKALVSSSTDCPAVSNMAEDLLFLLYTSGSTGKPKGIGHSSAGYLLYAAVTHKHVFDYHVGDVFGCVADIGWITGHSYVVYGPLANGATTVLFESIPTYPNPGRYWETVSRLGITQFYCAPTSLRLLLRSSEEWPKKYDLSSLRILGSVGEPLNQEAWHWYNDVVGNGKCTVVDTWWQTETGGIMLSPRPSSPGAKIIPGLPMRPLFGINPVLVDTEGKVITEDERDGALCINSLWPGIARTVYGDHQRFIDTYFKPFPGYFFTGDGAVRHKNGYYQITGRMDDVINVTGHRLGTAEVEDVMDEHETVAETAVVGFPHEIKGEGIYAFVVLKDKVKETPEEIKVKLKAMVKSQIAGYAVPEKILIVPSLPKTRSGKIMRRILRKIASGADAVDLGDTSTLADPSIPLKVLSLYRQQAEPKP